MELSGPADFPPATIEELRRWRERIQHGAPLAYGIDRDDMLAWLERDIAKLEAETEQIDG